MAPVSDDSELEDEFLPNSGGSSESEYEEEDQREPRKVRSRAVSHKRESRARTARPAPVPTRTRDSLAKDNLQERLEKFFGTSDADLVEGMQLRARFGDLSFSVLPEQLLPLPKFKPAKVNSNALSSLKASSAVPAPGHACNVDGKTLVPHACMTDEVSTILNTGFSITSIDWSPENLLAVSLAWTAERPIDMSSIPPYRNMCPLIYVYDTSGKSPKLVGSIRGDEPTGAPLSARWRPGSRDLAILSANSDVYLVSFQRGHHTVTDFVALNSATPEIGTLTQMAWRTPSDLVVGSSEGWLAEFDVTHADFKSPSYVVKAHFSAVSALATGWPNHPESVFSSAVDGYFVVYDVRDLRKLTRPPRSRISMTCGAYIPLIQSYLTLEDPGTTVILLLREPSAPRGSMPLTQHKAEVTAAAASPQHAVIATGAQDGTLNISNAMRRAIRTNRQKSKLHDVCLWQLQCSHKSAEYRFVTRNEVSVLITKSVTKSISLYPPQVSIVDIGWQGTCVATATAAGLIRFDNVST